MEFYANEGKQVEIQVGNRRFARHAIKTRFVQVGDDYISLIKEYVVPVYQPGDLVSLSEKVISLCQKRVVYENDVRPSLLARFLCKFVRPSAAGPGLSIPYKMQFAINKCGALRVIWAAIVAGFGKLIGKRGIFYRMLGLEVSGLDGFYGNDIPAYAHMGIMLPDQPDKVCDEILEKTGVTSMIVDANALSVDILGRASTIKEDTATLVGMIRDNPAGQTTQFTPFILIREIKPEQEADSQDANPGSQEADAKDIDAQQETGAQETDKQEADAQETDTQETGSQEADAQEANS